MDTMESSDDDNDNGDISDDNEYSAFDPSLLDLDSGFEDDDNIASGTTASSSIETHLYLLIHSMKCVNNLMKVNVNCLTTL